MPSADDIVKFVICLWFSFALLAGLLLFFDKFLVPFIPYILKYFNIIHLVFMLTSILLPFFGLLSIYHTICTLITYIPYKFIVFLCTVLIISLQIVFVDQIFPYNSQFNAKYLLLQYLYPLLQAYFSI